MIKLHLGSGGAYFSGYTNIDLPGNGYSARINQKVDLAKDITKLRYPKNSVDEIRLHHVFEHFQRAQSLALLASWNAWLIPGGLLRIEVPDFDRTARIVLNPLASRRAKKKALRHIFGSQEEDWAVHWEGWSEKSFHEVLPLFGFTNIKIAVIKYNGLYSIDASCQKSRSLTKIEAKSAAATYLKDFLTDSSESEHRVLNIWLKIFAKQLTSCWPK